MGESTWEDVGLGLANMVGSAGFEPAICGAKERFATVLCDPSLLYVQVVKCTPRRTPQGGNLASAEAG